jgi:hypothetical protein
LRIGRGTTCRGFLGRLIPIVGGDSTAGTRFSKSLIVIGIDVRDGLDSRPGRTNRAAASSRFRVARLETDTHIGLRRLGVHPTGHHPVFALIFRNQAIGLAGL